jgi:RNA polymerase sigma-70 factor (ECF subfamily)
MTENQWLADRFEEHRARLRAVAYRMLGSLTEADDAVQDTWLRVSQAGAGGVDDLGAWLTTIVARVCLNALRTRNRRREEEFGVHSVGLALLIVLDTLTPAERLAFVLHDSFQLPFEDIAPLVERTPAAARQLASRARRRVQGADLRVPDSDVRQQRTVVDAFFAAARTGDFDGLVSLLDPDAVLRPDFGRSRPPMPPIRGAQAVASAARSGADPASVLHPVLVNGLPGVVVTLHGQYVAVLGFVVAGGKIREIDAIGDVRRIRRIAAHAVPL